MQPIYEIATYKVLPSTGKDRLKEALAPLHAYVAGRPGCLGIQSFIAEDGICVTDVLAWRNKAEADAAMAATQHHSSLQALMPLVEPDSFRPTYGQLLLETRP